MGTAFVVILLCLFIGKRNALFAGIGIPVSLMCTFIFIFATGGSLNTSSLFALMMVVGIIVDDAIVIIENCYRYIHMGMSPKEAAIAGTTEVMGPVFTACLTTVAAFSPLMLMPDIIGKFLRVVPIVVCLALIASLLEAFLILPSHIADWSSKKTDEAPVRERITKRLKKIYTRQLTFVLRRRYSVIASVTAAFIGCISLILFGVIERDMYTLDEISQLYVNITMPEGTNLETTNRVMLEVENRLKNGLPKHEVEATVTNVGMLITDEEWIMNTAVGHIMLDLVEHTERNRSIEDIVRHCRRLLSDMVEPTSLGFITPRLGPPVSADIEVKVVGKYLDQIKKASKEIKALVATIPGVDDIQDDLSFGKKDLKIYVDEDKAALYGLDLLQVASTIRNACDGRVATIFREGDDEIDVVVKFDADKVATIEDIENIKIMTPRGQTIPFRNLGHIKVEPG
ncbi:MAG: efflux RND transporter permease subunit, partial [Deltaproteobacteria bacterium]|nr:efflux RND transporter permease subunit [Deltaproteobacteria bacterium]